MATYTISRPWLNLDLELQTVDVLNREDSFKPDLLQIFEAVQADRRAALAEVRELQLAAELLLNAESARLQALDPTDARIAVLARSGEAVLDRIELLDRELAVAAIRVPPVKRSEALIHGRITDSADRAAGRVTVTLADEKGEPVPGVPPVEVDSAGYYALVVPADAATHIPAEAKLTLVLDNGVDRLRPATTSPITVTTGAVKVEDVRLSEGELGKLKLRPTIVPSRTARRTRGTPPGKPAAKPKPTARKRR